MEEQPVFLTLGKMFLWLCNLLQSNEHKHCHCCSDPEAGAMLQLDFLDRYMTHKTSIESITK